MATNASRSLSSALAALGVPPEPQTAAGRISSQASIRRAVAIGEVLQRERKSAAPAAPFRQYNHALAPSGPVPDEIRLAFDLAKTPNRARLLRTAPLPSGMLSLIRIAGGCPITLKHTAQLTGRDPVFIRASVMHYLEEVLWTKGLSHYRALGATRNTPHEDLATHLGWLMKWLGSSLGTDKREAVFAERVVAAWEALKTPERRAQYDRKLFGGQVMSGNSWLQRRWTMVVLAIAGIGVLVVVTISGGMPFGGGSGLAGVVNADIFNTPPNANLEVRQQ